MKKFKQNFFFLFFLISGIVLGALAAHLCEGKASLSWIAYHLSLGINQDTPLVLDLSVMQLTFGLQFSIYVAQIFTVGLAMLLFSRIFRKG